VCVLPPPTPQVARLGRKEAELAAALSAFGSAGEALGKFDDGSLRGCFDVLSARAGQIAAASRKRCEDLQIEFEEPLHEATRSIRSVQVAMAARSHALSAYVQAKGDFETKKIRLAKLRGTPGLKEDKLTEAERDVNVADQQVRNTKLEYDTIASRMTEELNRFQKERAADMAALMRNFAVTQAAFAAENARGWNALLEDIQGQLGEPAAAFG
jgi:sorting nexin-1/2